MRHTLEELLQPGNKVREFYNEGNLNNRILHIRAIVDEEVIVFKVWSKRKQYWWYFAESLFYFELRYEKKYLSFAGKEVKQ